MSQMTPFGPREPATEEPQAKTQSCADLYGPNRRLRLRFWYAATCRGNSEPVVFRLGEGSRQVATYESGNKLPHSIDRRLRSKPLPVFD